MISTADNIDTTVILIDDTSYSNISSLLMQEIQQESIRALQQITTAQAYIEIIERPEPLMYKGWMTPEQYGKYLYLQLFKSRVKSYHMKGKIYIDHLKTFRRYQRR